MSEIIDMYEEIHRHLSDIFNKYIEVDERLSDFKEEDEVTRQVRIDNFDKQLKDIGVYYARVEYFRQLAEKNITSKNILSLTGLELDFNSLRHDAARIDSQNPDCPYARRLYVHARCNEIYLMQKQKEFEEKRELLISGKNDVLEKLKEQVSNAKKRLEKECELYVRSEEFDKFSTLLDRIHYKFSDELYTEGGLQGSRAYESKDKKISIGLYAQPLMVLGEEAKKSVKLRLGKYYDEKSQSVLLPVEFESSEEFVINIKTVTSKENRCFKGISNLLLNLIKRTKPGNRKFKIEFIDAIHFNNSQLKVLRPLEDSAVISKIPQNEEEIDGVLGRIVSTFPDIDETLQDFDTVKDYNDIQKDDSQKIERKVVVLVGYPNAFSVNAKKYIDRIIYNHHRYGISIILVENIGFEEQEKIDKDKKTNKLSKNYYNILMPQNSSTTIEQGDGVVVGYRWYEYDYKTHEIPESYIEQIRLDDDSSNQIVNEYIKRFPLDTYYYKDRDDEARKKIVLPYGVDSEGNVSEVSFEAESFAAYLMGASGSGKSTLLHTLITGIIRNYHPDDVELWLADFKMAEFSQYIDPLPPHVKYILLDESRELVFDLVDRLTDEMLKRQKFFMKNRDIKKVEDVPSSEYMPVIFVILDEFSIMSQVLETEESYKLKLQNLLAKGRALGIKFIFSSQSYMTGIKGLTATAKEQIQTRIAMHNSSDEINETLELPRFLKNEQNTFLIETLPVHMALRKYHKSENEMVLERVNVMYFKGDANHAYEPQRMLINLIQNKLQAIDKDEFNGTNTLTYVNKNPVIVDGNSYDAYVEENLKKEINNYREEHIDDISDDDTLVSFGTPRRMVNYLFAGISKESRENILLISRASEQACTASILFSTIKSFKLQNRKVKVWVYEKNRLFRTYRNVFENIGVGIVLGIDAICDDIRILKERIIKNEAENELIVMIGMEHICADFDYVSNIADLGMIIDKREDVAQGQIISDEDKRRKELADEFFKLWAPLNEKLIAQGKTPEEIKAIKCEHMKEFKENNKYIKPVNTQPKISAPLKESVETIANKGAYNAKSDYEFVVKSGSRLGYHFVQVLNSFSDLKTTGLKLDYFRYRLSFQVSVDDSRTLFNSKVGSTLPEHICQFDDTLERYSFRPYLHEGVEWDGWYIEDGKVISPFE